MAILIMTVGLLGLLQSLQVAYRHAARTKLQEEAVQVAEEQMNDFRLLAFERITAQCAVGNLEREVVGATRTFEISRDCRPLGVSSDKCRPEDDSKKLTVAVTWQFQNVTAHQVIYSVKNR